MPFTWNLPFGDIRYGTETNTPNVATLETVSLHSLSSPPSDAVERHDDSIDIVLAPIRGKDGRGQILLKRIWLVFSKIGNPINATLRIYMKGNTPQWGSADNPDYNTTFQIKDGNIYVDVPHLVSEAFIIRITWTPDISVGDIWYYGADTMEVSEEIRNYVRLLAVYADIEDYGDRENIWGDDYA